MGLINSETFTVTRPVFFLAESERDLVPKGKFGGNFFSA